MQNSVGLLKKVKKYQIFCIAFKRNISEFYRSCLLLVGKATNFKRSLHSDQYTVVIFFYTTDIKVVVNLRTITL